MRILAITGGVASGKSTVATMFGDLGATVVSADSIARELLAPGTSYTHEVAAAFPNCVLPKGFWLDQNRKDVVGINRRALGRLIFADPQARSDLESILHPPIVAELNRQIEALRASDLPALAVIEIPLLFEGGHKYDIDKAVVVACDFETQVERLRERLGINREDAMRQIESQWPLARKIPLADYVITTDLGLEETRAQVGRVWEAETGL